MAVEAILKQPGEVLRHAVRLPIVVAAIGAVTVIARGLVPGAPLLTAVPELANGVITLTLSAGGDGERYLVTVAAVGADGASAETELDVAVIDAAWIMPDGGVPYLTIAEFVGRVGLPEVIARTDGVGDGRIDRALLIGVLSDAQATIDAHLAGRYAVPLSDPPLIVQKMMTDLARAALYPDGAPDGIADQAKQTLRMLERIQAGQMPIPAATPPAPAANADNPVLISPGRRAYPDGLDGYARGWPL